MVIGAARVVLRIESSHSLKDKRQVVKSILARVQREFRVAAAEVDELDNWQLAVLGLTCVSTESGHADSLLAHAVRFIDQRFHDAEMVGFATETLHVL